MNPFVIIELISKVGLPLANELITRYHAGNNPVSKEEWEALVKLASYRSADSLALAGVKIENGKVVPA